MKALASGWSFGNTFIPTPPKRCANLRPWSSTTMTSCIELWGAPLRACPPTRSAPAALCSNLRVEGPAAFQFELPSAGQPGSISRAFGEIVRVVVASVGRCIEVRARAHCAKALGLTVFTFQAAYRTSCPTTNLGLTGYPSPDLNALRTFH